MQREAGIPLVLWICTALVAHLAGGGGAVQVAHVVLDREALRAAIRAEREILRPGDTTFEILTDSVQPSPGAKTEPPEKESDGPDDGKESEPDEEEKAPPPVAPPPLPKVAEAPPPPPPEPPKPEKKVEVPVVPLPPAPPAPPPPPLPPPDKRIAIKQHVEKNQKDNPEASRIADDANHTKEETVARIRSKDQDAPKPTAGSPTRSAPSLKDGNNDHTKIADSEEKKGNEQNAPGESKKDSTTATHSNPAPPQPGSPRGGGGGKGGGKVAAANPGAPAGPASRGGAGPASPEVQLGGGKPGWTVDPANPGGDGKSRVAGKKRKFTPMQSPVSVGSMGLGGAGTPGGPNTNLPLASVEQVVGVEKLKQERAADGAARKSAHLGSSKITSWQQMKAAIENYEPSVKEGNQTSLNAAQSVFASYLNTIHNRIHPIFAEQELVAMNGLPKSDPMQKSDLVAHVEIVLSKDQGRIVRAGIKKHSGSTAYDTIAIASVLRAGPFGKAPDAIVSPDGNVYLHWEFHRDPFDACTTRNARPYLLKEAPKPKSSPTGAPPKKVPATSPDDRPQDPPGPLRPLRQ
jgi:hypothetical protein